VAFGGFRALDGAASSPRGGEVVGLIGPNGAGKTTLVNVITGMVPATDGSVALDGRGTHRRADHRIARAGLVRTFQNLRLFSSLTVRDNVEAAALVGCGSIAISTDRCRASTHCIAAAGLWEHPRPTCQRTRLRQRPASRTGTRAAAMAPGSCCSTSRRAA
jgi:ABC-type branched-subunit amino acid transport system ATPase component